MYTNLSKTMLVATIFSLVTAPALALSDKQLQQLDKAVVKANQSHEEKIKDFHAYVNDYLDKYEAWRNEYTKKLDAKRADLIKVWGEGDVSTQTKDIEYSKDNSIKTMIDYEANEATVSVLVDSDRSPEETQQLIKNLSVDVAGQKVDLEKLKPEDHSVLYSLEKEQEEKNFVIQQTQRQMNELDIQAEMLINSKTGIPDSFIYQRSHKKKLALLAQAKERIAAQAKLYNVMRAKYGIVVKQQKEKPLLESKASLKTNAESRIKEVPKTKDTVTSTAQDEIATSENANKPEVIASTEKPKRIVSYKIKLPENSLKIRASKYAPLAEKESKNWKVDAALIMAIMHSESAFRPDAKSDIPAFGLMQVVPTSAGYDVNKQVRKINAPMEPSELYKPVVNVETGTAYLDILNSKYLRKIENDKSRLFCVIAAYNTGAGNVARAFNKDHSTNINKASKVINSMSPEQVYKQLLSKLPYDETKGYLKKVSSRIALYQSL